MNKIVSTLFLLFSSAFINSYFCLGINSGSYKKELNPNAKAYIPTSRFNPKKSELNVNAKPYNPSWKEKKKSEKLY
ncbi:hypothetical protein HYV11_02050 [Candidatus Dependentiae bacterium]|nr:hypothetical protein [Candidatus Dependentiae bacterium]